MAATRYRAPREPRPGHGATREVFKDGRSPRLYRGAPETESACGDTLVAMVVFVAAVTWLRVGAGTTRRATAKRAARKAGHLAAGH
jgi:hypothetical protein